MRRPIILVIALVFALALLARAVTYNVRFTEAGVLTTFGRAVETDLAKVREPGLKFKWPDPIQSVTKYDTRSRFLQTKAEQQQTADSRQVTVEAFCTWRVIDPLKFFQRFSNAGDRAQDHFKKAEDLLRANLRSAMGEVSKYRMGDLFTSTPGASKLGELERRALATLTAGGGEAGGLGDYGIEVSTVGVNRIVLPEETTKAVFESMKADRDRLVKALASKGQSEAQAITTAASKNAGRIQAFAKAYAAEIIKQGEMEAQQYVAPMNENPELAVFLKNIEMIRELEPKRITTVLSPSTPGFGIMSPATMQGAVNGKIPGIDGLMGDLTKPPATVTQNGGAPSTLAAPPSGDRR